MAIRMAPRADRLSFFTKRPPRKMPRQAQGIAVIPSSWLAEEVVRLNCCSRYLPRKAAKPATTAISMQAARTMQVNTGFESRCLVTLGITLSCWKQEALLSGSRGCLRTPLLGLGLSYSLSGSMACSLSMPGSECGGRDCGNPNIRRDEKKSKAPQSRKPPHQAPIQRGSSGVMSRLLVS